MDKSFEEIIATWIPKFGNPDHLKALELIKKVKSKRYTVEDRDLWKNQILKLIK